MLPIHEKGDIHLDTAKTPFGWSIRKYVHIFACILIAAVYCILYLIPTFQIQLNSSNPDSLCPIVSKLDPTDQLYNNSTIEKILSDPTFKKESIEKLANAVRIPTEIYDDTINPNSAKTKKELYKLEPLWEEYEKFHKFLAKTFPKTFKHLTVETVNKFGLILTWQGSDKGKQPLMLTAHMDVVPVQRETVDQWTYGPFSGEYDGEYLYGRGVSDCKNLLIGLLETVELLLEEGEFNPQRTLLLAFGYDEESSGTGAEEISKVLLEKYGEESIYAIIDEGNEGVEEIEGLKFILPATGEKGHLNSIIELFTPGGHSSVPPLHTLIGILAKLIDKIESSPFESILTNANPVLNQLQCVAEHSKTVDTTLKKDILQAHFNPLAQEAVIDYISKELTRYLVATSQAVDIIKGGAKSNALPEHASVLVNHRIAIEETVALTAEKVLSEIKTLANKFNLGIVFNGNVLIEPTKNGYFNYTLNEPLEPSPVTPINDKVWQTFGGSLRYLYEDLIFPETKEQYIPAPYISIGNTDTKSYWSLSKHIFRYSPGIDSGLNIHSVDEKLRFNAHLQIVAFYYYYIQVVDQLDDTLS